MCTELLQGFGEAISQDFGTTSQPSDLRFGDRYDVPFVVAYNSPGAFPDRGFPQHISSGRGGAVEFTR
jgi:hypothetical protein